MPDAYVATGGAADPAGSVSSEEFDRAAGHLFGWEGAGPAVQVMRQAVTHPAGIFGGGPAVIDIMDARPDPIRLEMTRDDANL